MTAPDDSMAGTEQRLPNGVTSRYVMAGGIQTHYLEAGEGEPVILLHSGEFGGRAAFSWHSTIGALVERFHVYAPDMVGFGRTEKLVAFADGGQFRVRHIRAFMDVLCIPSAHFIGNSFGASLIQTVAGQDSPAWNMRSIVSVSGGGHAPNNVARQTLTEYDGARESMRAILKVLFWDERFWSDEMVEAHWHASVEPGAFEAVAASRVAVPGREKGFRPERGDPAKIRVPTLLVGGDRDLLREPGCWEDLQRRIPGAELKIFSPARHCPHLEFPQEFNALAWDFLERHCSD